MLPFAMGCLSSRLWTALRAVEAVQSSLLLRMKRRRRKERSKKSPSIVKHRLHQRLRHIPLEGVRVRQKTEVQEEGEIEVIKPISHGRLHRPDRGRANRLRVQLTFLAAHHLQGAEESMLIQTRVNTVHPNEAHTTAGGPVEAQVELLGGMTIIEAAHEESRAGMHLSAVLAAGRTIGGTIMAVRGDGASER